LDSGTYFFPNLNDNASHDTKVVAVGPAPESMTLFGQRAFKGCSNLEAFDGTVRAIKVYEMLQNCSSLKSFPLINTSGVTDFGYAWTNCSSLTSFPLIDTSSAGTMVTSWGGCSSLTSFPQINTSSVTNFQASWQNCFSLTSFPLIDTSSGTNFAYSWYGCSGLTSFPLIDTSSGTNFTYAWFNCTNLTSFPLIDTSSGTNFTYAWRNCTGLTSFPLINTASGTNFLAAWYDCSGLTSFPLIDTSSSTNFSVAWYNCNSLSDFPANFFDSWTGTPANNCFVQAWDVCSSLTATSVENIYNSISVSPSSSTPPASGTNIDVDYNASTGTPDITVSAIDLTAKGWTPTLNGTSKANPYSFASLDLDFATNKTLNDNISGNNLITFTRNSIGTYVDSNGVIQTATANTPRFDHDPETGESLGLLVEESRTNLLLNSSTFFNKASGTIKGFRFISNATIPKNTPITVSFYIKPKSTSRRSININSDNVGYFGFIDTSTLPINQWSRVSITATLTGTGSENFIDIEQITSTTPTYTENAGVSPDGTITSCEITDGTYTYEFWGAQLEAGSFPTSYIPTPATFTSRNSIATYYDANGVIQTAGVDVARDDAYFPDADGVMRPAGLLLEAAGTNRLTYSEQFDNEAWNTNGGIGATSTVTSNQVAAPDGNLTADKIQSNGSSSGRMQFFSSAAATTYTFSVFAKKATSSIATFYLDRFAGNWAAGSINPYISYNFDTQAISTNNSSVVGRAEKIGNGWVRLSVTATKSASGSSYGGWSGGPTDDVYAWGAQLETGSYATSYIPTSGSEFTRAADVSTSSTVTRAADVASITGTNFSSWYNQSEGTTLIALKNINSFNYSGAPFIAYDGNNNIWDNTNEYGLRYNSSGTTFEAVVRDSSAGFKQLQRLGDYRNSATAVIAINTSTFSYTANGLSVLTTSLDAPLSTMTSYTFTGYNPANPRQSSRISRLTYWPKRLTDTSLQYLTQ
jgi:hypothetical protein